MKISKLFIVFISVSLSSLGQQRIGLDFSSKFNSLCATVTYNFNFKGHFILSTGIFAGKFGRSFNNMELDQYATGRRIKTPFAKMNDNEWDTEGNSYELYEYITKGSGVGIQLGLGYYHEFSVIHGIRFNLNMRAGWMKSRLSASYFNEGIGFLQKRKEQNHFAGALSPELYHTIRINGRFTFYYGIKAPYFFTFDNAKFKPKQTKDLFYYWEPELALGVTYVIGKCD